MQTRTLYGPEPEGEKGVTVSRCPCFLNETIKERKSYDQFVMTCVVLLLHCPNIFSR